MGRWTLGKPVSTVLIKTDPLIGTAARSLKPKLLKGSAIHSRLPSGSFEREECEHDEPFYSNNSKPGRAPTVRVALEKLNAS